MPDHRQGAEEGLPIDSVNPPPDSNRDLDRGRDLDPLTIPASLPPIVHS